MKNHLLATSALFLTAGVASAEISFSGTAGAGIFKQGKTTVAAADSADLRCITTAAGAATVTNVADSATGACATGSEVLSGTEAVAAADVKAADHYSVYSGIDINIKASTTTDNGMTISAATDMGAGSLLDAADRELDAQTDDLTAPKVKIGYNGVTVELQSEGVDDYYDGDLDNYDVGITGSFGGLSYGIALETESNTASDYSATLGYSVAGVSLTANTNHVDGGTDKTSISASYTMGAVKATLKNDNMGAAKDVNSLTLAYTAGPAVITVAAKDDKNHSGNTNKAGRQSWDLTVAYTTGAYTINATTNESDAWNANVNYDLGGGATMTVGADSTETSFAGVSFAF